MVLCRLSLAIAATAVAFPGGSIATPSTFQPTASTVVRIDSDGWRLAGTYVRPAPDRATGAAVLLLNGAARDRRAYIPLAGELARRGVASLRLDLRGEGESTNRGRFEPGVNAELLEGSDRDVAAALEWLRAQRGIEPDRIGVLGASYSGEAMAVAARRGSPAAAYVALSPGSLSDESVEAIDRQRAPWWLIASRDERFARAVVERAATMTRSARVTIVAGTSHASDILSPHFVLNAEIADWFASALRRAEAPPLWGGLPQGPWPVGFTRLHAQSTLVDLWYPAARPGAPMTYREYLELSDDLRGATPDFPNDAASVQRTLAAAITGDQRGLTDDQTLRIMSAAMAAHRDAPPLSGQFPIVLWTPRYATTAAQAVLSEFLASHGFVLAAMRPAGAEIRLPFELKTDADREAELRARVEDMRHALAAVSSRPATSSERVGVIAWSYTGEMATRFQLEEPRIRLVAGLSTTLLNDWVYVPDALPALDVSRLTAAYAVFTQSGEADAARPPLLGRIRTSYFVDMPGLAHGSFNALEGFIPSVLGITRVQQWSHSGAATKNGYEAVAVMLLRLLRHHVEGDRAEPLPRLALTTGIAPGIVREPR